MYLPRYTGDRLPDRRRLPQCHDPCRLRGRRRYKLSTVIVYNDHKCVRVYGHRMPLIRILCVYLCIVYACRYVIYIARTFRVSSCSLTTFAGTYSGIVYAVHTYSVFKKT
jgi:hypothetical protein